MNIYKYTGAMARWASAFGRKLGFANIENVTNNRDDLFIHMKDGKTYRITLTEVKDK